jgi:hypothetical protein
VEITCTELYTSDENAKGKREISVKPQGKFGVLASILTKITVNQ